MTQQTVTQSVRPQAPFDTRCAGAGQVCPECGTACNHTPQEMQGFAMDALQQASDGLARDEEACRRANEADAAALATKSAFRSADKSREEVTIELLTQQVAELRSSPPTTFMALDNDGTFREWMRRLADSSTTHRERKAIVRSLRELIKACAEEQRSASVTALYKAVLTENWVPMSCLPPPYEEVRILTDGVARIARLAHDKSHFQLATFLANTKSQYVVSVDRVQGWQPLFAAPGNGAPVAPATA
jgi:hypothetical protein